jgi:hypothetical protein
MTEGGTTPNYSRPPQRPSGVGRKDQSPAVTKFIMDMQDQNTALRDALTRYGGHTDTCDASAWAVAANPRGRMCRCGWSRVVRTFGLKDVEEERS